MVQKEQANPPKKASLPLLPLLLSLLLSAAVGFGVFYGLKTYSESDSKTQANAITQNAANIVNAYFDDVTSKSKLLFANPSKQLKHAYPLLLDATGIPSELTFSEQDFVSRGRLNPNNTTPEVTLSRLPNPENPEGYIEKQTVSLLKQLESGQYLLVRWSLEPVKQQLANITPDNIQVALKQQDSHGPIDVLSIHENKLLALDEQALKYNTWSIQTSYNTKEIIQPHYAGAGAGLAILLLSLFGVSVTQKRKNQRFAAQVASPVFETLDPESNIKSQTTPHLGETDSVESADISVSEQTEPTTQPQQQPQQKPQPDNITKSRDAQNENATEPNKLMAQPAGEEKLQETKPNTPIKNNDPSNPLQSVVAEEMVFEHPDLSVESEDTTVNNPTSPSLELDAEVLADLESEIKSDNQTNNAPISFKAPIIPEVGKLEVPTTPHTEQYKDAASQLDDGNVVEFEGFSPAPKTSDSHGESQHKSTSPINQNIADVFRTFDIRGTQDQLNDKHVVKIAKGIATLLIEKGQYHIVVGRDVRASGKRIAETLVRSLIDQGIRVVDIGIVTTPLMVFAAQNSFGCGIIITASHNPADFNGFKWIINNESPTKEQVLALKKIVLNETFAEPIGKGSLQTESFDKSYADAIQKDIMLADLPKVVIDCMHGATCKLAPSIIEDAGCVVSIINDNMDGNFSTGNPNPTEKNRLELLSKAVINKGATIGFAFDCDGDRIAVVDEMGQTVSSEHLLCLFAKILLETNPAADIAYDIKCSRHVANTITAFGGRPVLRPTGSAILRETIKQSPQTVFAGELSGHFIFNDDRLGNYDDGIYTALRLLEWLTQTGMPLSTHIQELPASVSTDDVYLKAESSASANQQINEIIEHWKKSQNNASDSTQTIKAIMTNIDGFRLDYESGFGILRPSNTMNAITVRFSAADTDTLTDIKHKFSELVSQVNPKLAEQIDNI